MNNYVQPRPAIPGLLSPASSIQPRLFQPLQLRSVQLKNRIVLSPMCMYASRNGFASTFHAIHLGSFAQRGVGLIMTEATAVSPDGRITPRCLGLWQDEHTLALKQVVEAVKAVGPQVAVGIQLAHAGRKGSSYAPWMKGGHGECVRPQEEDEEGNGCLGFDVMAPSAVPFSSELAEPSAMTLEEIRKVRDAFKAAAERALHAGFDVVEIHAAHGYLLHQFLSPYSNKRTDHYGGSFTNRIRLVVEICQDVRSVWPLSLPLFLRLSCTDWLDSEGWTLDQTQELTKILAEQGLVDVVDCSSGGLSVNQKLPALEQGYQLPLAQAVREQGIKVGAVGLLVDPEYCEQILKEEKADLIFLARVLLRDASWTYRAAEALGVGPYVQWSLHYERGRLKH